MGGNAADIEIRARAFWTDVEGDSLAAGFAASEDPEDWWPSAYGYHFPSLKIVPPEQLPAVPLNVWLPANWWPISCAT